MKRSPRFSATASEAQIQASIVARWDFLKAAGQIPAEYTLFAIRNEQAHGGKAAARQGAHLNAQGRRKGIPDLQVAHDAGRHWWGEVKSAYGRLTADQREYGERVLAAGGGWAVWRSQDDAERSWREWGILA